MLKNAVGLDNDELYDVFQQWNEGELNSYLIEITRDIFSVKDDLTGGYLVDLILDTAGAKGTGKWMSQLALDLGVPSTLVTEAVYARCLSAMKDARVRASKLLKGPTDKFRGDRAEVHRAGAPGPVRLEDLQLRPRLRADAGRRQGAQLAAQFRRDRPAVAWRVHHSGRVSRTHQRSLRRQEAAGEPAAGAVFQDGRSQGADRVAQRGDHGRAAGHSHAGLLPRPWPTTTATAPSVCRPTCCKPSATTSAPTRTIASTARACSTAIGCDCGKNHP